jgi:hypothetical protein
MGWKGHWNSVKTMRGPSDKVLADRALDVGRVNFATNGVAFLVRR